MSAPSIIYVKPAVPSRRVRQRRGSAHLMKARAQALAMGADMETALLNARADWEEAIRADERAGWGSGDKWRHVQRVQRETRHHVAQEVRAHLAVAGIHVKVRDDIADQIARGDS